MSNVPPTGSRRICGCIWTTRGKTSHNAQLDRVHVAIQLLTRRPRQSRPLMAGVVGVDSIRGGFLSSMMRAEGASDPSLQLATDVLGFVDCGPKRLALGRLEQGGAGRSRPGMTNSKPRHLPDGASSHVNCVTHLAIAFREPRRDPHARVAQCGESSRNNRSAGVEIERRKLILRGPAAHMAAAQAASRIDCSTGQAVQRAPGG